MGSLVRLVQKPKNQRQLKVEDCAPWDNTAQFSRVLPRIVSLATTNQILVRVPVWLAQLVFSAPTLTQLLGQRSAQPEAGVRHQALQSSIKLILAN